MKTKEAKYWIEMVCLVAYPKPTLPLKRAKISYVRHSSSPIDGDNLAISFKHVQDGLVHAGIIENDSWNHIGMPNYSWKKATKKEGFITIEVEEVQSLD